MCCCRSACTSTLLPVYNIDCQLCISTFYRVGTVGMENDEQVKKYFITLASRKNWISMFLLVTLISLKSHGLKPLRQLNYIKKNTA